MIDEGHDACWTCEAIDGIEEALNVEWRDGTMQSDDDLSHVPTFGTLVDAITGCA